MSTTTIKKDPVQQHTDRAREAAAGAADKVKDAASQAGSALSGAAQSVKDAASQAVAGTTDKLKDAASQTGQAVTHAAEAVGHKAEQATASVGSGIQSLADTVRERGPTSGVFGHANEAVANTLEGAGRYIEDKNLTGMVDDMSNVIRKNPIPALLIGVGVGFLLGRALRS